MVSAQNPAKPTFHRCDEHDCPWMSKNHDEVFIYLEDPAQWLVAIDEAQKGGRTPVTGDGLGNPDVHALPGTDVYYVDLPDFVACHNWPHPYQAVTVGRLVTQSYKDAQQAIQTSEAWAPPALVAAG